MSVLSILWLAGCGPDLSTTSVPLDAAERTEPEAPAPIAPPPPAPCDNEVTSSFPRSGASDVYYQTAIELVLALPDDTARLAVVDEQGETIPGTSTSQGTTLSWAGDPLAPETAHRVILSWRCAPVEIDWTTSSTGAPLERSVHRNTYGLDLRSGRWLQPRGLEAVLGGLVQPLLVSVSEEPEGLSLLAAVAEDGRQPRCEETSLVAPVSFTDPAFALEDGSLSLVFEDLFVQLETLSMSGAFSPSGDRIEGLHLSGLLDTRPLGEAIVAGAPDDLICEILAGLQIPCVSCGDGAPYCLETSIDDLDLPLRPGASVRPRDLASIAQDPQCG